VLRLPNYHYYCLNHASNPLVNQVLLKIKEILFILNSNFRPKSRKFLVWILNSSLWIELVTKCKQKPLVQVSSKLQFPRRSSSQFYCILNLEASLFFIWNPFRIWRSSYGESSLFLQNPSQAYFISNFSSSRKSFLDRSKLIRFEFHLNLFEFEFWIKSTTAAPHSGIGPTRQQPLPPLF
jgi:hypothetical protein